MRFNPPPNWPSPPEGWTPPRGWQPAADWPPAPEGWAVWVEETPDLVSTAPEDAHQNAAFHLRLSTIVSSIGLLGVVIYGITYLAGYVFYAQFGVAPEDVGFTKEGALAHAGYFLVGLFIIAILILSIPLLVFVILDFALGNSIWNWSHPLEMVRRRLTRSIRGAMILALAWAVIGAYFAVGISAQVIAQSVIDGQRPDHGWGSAFTNSTGVTFTLEDATWTTPGTDRPILVHKTVALLGQNGGVTVMYVYDTRLVVRVPSSSVDLAQTVPTTQ